MITDPFLLPVELVPIATRAANEGIPVAAIGRLLAQPFDLVSEALQEALGIGHISSMPRADWIPSQAWDKRAPPAPRGPTPEDIEFQCRNIFKLTGLEAGFVAVLLRFDHADKERLHGVIERRRRSRPQRVDAVEETDPKMVDVIICKLRKKLRDVDPALIINTTWGSGYYFAPDMRQKIYRLIAENSTASAQGSV